MLRTSTLAAHNCRITKSALLLPEETYYYLAEEAQVAHQRVVAAHNCRITNRDLQLPEETYYYLEEEAHVAHQHVSAAQLPHH